MTRIQEFEAAVKKVSMDYIKSNMPEPKMLHADMNWNLETIGYTWDVTTHKVAAGLEKRLIESFKMEVCKKSEALYLLTIGEKTEAGCFIVKKYKNYWLRMKPE